MTVEPLSDGYRYHKKWRYDRDRGITRTVDATTTRLHIAACLGAGMSMSALAAAAGVSVQVVCKVHAGQRTVRRTTEARLLGVEPGVTFASRPDTSESFVPAIGTRRRIRALLAIGWPHAAITAAAGPRSAVALHQQGRWVTKTKHDAFARAYRELASKPGPSAKTRRWAEKLGYHGPLAWDDIDRDPDPEHDRQVDGGRRFEDADPVVVERVLSGDWPLARRANPAERVEITGVWTDRGLPLAELERLTGWRVERYVSRGLSTPEVARLSTPSVRRGLHGSGERMFDESVPTTTEGVA